MWKLLGIYMMLIIFSVNIIMTEKKKIITETKNR